MYDTVVYITLTCTLLILMSHSTSHYCSVNTTVVVGALCIMHCMFFILSLNPLFVILLFCLTFFHVLIIIYLCVCVCIRHVLLCTSGQHSVCQRENLSEPVSSRREGRWSSTRPADPVSTSCLDSYCMKYYSYSMKYYSYCMKYK